MNFQSDILKLIKTNKTNEARKLIDQSVTSRAQSYYFYGLCSCSEGKYKNAIFYFRLACLNGFEHYLLYYNLGVAFLEINNYDKSIVYFNKSMQQNKYFIKNYINIAYIYSVKGDIKSAYRSIKTGLSYNNSDELNTIENRLFNLL